MANGDWSHLVGKGEKENVSWMKDLKDLLELDLFDYSKVGKIMADGDLVLLEFVALTRKFLSQCCTGQPLIQCHGLKLKGDEQSPMLILNSGSFAKCSRT